MSEKKVSISLNDLEGLLSNIRLIRCEPSGMRMVKEHANELLNKLESEGQLTKKEVELLRREYRL